MFSKFDCKSGFWQIKLEESSSPWTAFGCSEGHFQWNDLPFGSKNAPSIFQGKMDFIFNRKSYSDFCIVYIDDILVFSSTRDEHDDHLSRDFQSFLDNGIIISKKKMVLNQEYTEFLGLRIGRGEVEVQPHISKSILEMPDNLGDKKTL